MVLTSATFAPMVISERGRPRPSTSNMIFVPFPHFVLPTSAPLFLPRQKCHRLSIDPSAAVSADPNFVGVVSRRPSISPIRSNRGDDASTWQGTGSVLVIL